MHHFIHIFGHTLSFYNYDGFSFPYANKDLSIPIILLGLLLLTCLTFRKKTGSFLDTVMTDQMKGIAILAIILSHYITRVFVSTSPYYIYFKDTGGLGVSIFLLLSGFGLMMSYLKKKQLSSDYLPKRFLRVLLPYWVFTIVWVLLDLVLLHLHHTPKQLLEGIFGIVLIDDITRDINPSAWFVTYIMYMYTLFYLIFLLRLPIAKKILLLFVANALTALYSYFLAGHFGFNATLRWGDYSLFFPLGVLVAYKYDMIKTWIDPHLNRKNAIFFFTLLLLCAEVFGLHNNLILIFILLLPIVFLFVMKRVSRFLQFLGVISYELYLVHVLFIIKYDFILFHKPYFVSFFLFLAIMIGIAYIVHTLITEQIFKRVFP